MTHKLHIAFANRPDMVADAVESVRDIGNIHLWPNNGAEDPCIPGTTVHQLPVISAVDTINLMIQSSWDDDVMFWAHNDAYAKPGAAAELLRTVEECDQQWGAIFTHYDVLCAFNMKCIRDVGYWDPMFFQYTADIDYYRRIKMAGWPILSMKRGIEKVEHRHGSITVQSDEHYNMRVQWRQGTGFDHEYYKRKWGGPQGHEKFMVPFNGVRR